MNTHRIVASFTSPSLADRAAPWAASPGRALKSGPRVATIWRSVAVLILTLLAAVGCKSDPKPGEAAFQEANAKINVFEAEVGFGNSAAATALAKSFAVRIKADEKEAFEGGEDENTATTKGNFLTYCHETPTEILLLVRVPNLDTYSGETRTELVKMAWTAALELSAPLRKASPRKLSVALRGNLLYGGLASGTGVGEPQMETATSIDQSKLYPSFVTTPAAK